MPQRKVHKKLIEFDAYLSTVSFQVVVENSAAVNQHPQVFFLWAAFQPLWTQAVALKGVIVAKVQNPSLVLVETHVIGLSPSIQPVQVTLQRSLTLQQTNTLTQLGESLQVYQDYTQSPHPDYQ